MSWRSFSQGTCCTRLCSETRSRFILNIRYAIAILVLNLAVLYASFKTQKQTLYHKYLCGLSFIQFYGDRCGFNPIGLGYTTNGCKTANTVSRH